MCRCMRRASLGMLPHTVLTRFARASRPSWSDLDNCRIRGAWNMSSRRFEQAPPLYLPSLVMPSMRLVARSRNGFFHYDLPSQIRQQPQRGKRLAFAHRKTYAFRTYTCLFLMCSQVSVAHIEKSLEFQEVPGSSRTPFKAL